MPSHDPPATSPHATATAGDLARLRRYRLGRVRQELARAGLPAAVLLDPLNLRYALGTRNMQVFMLRNPARYAFVPVEGPVAVFEFPGAEHLVTGLDTVDEVRPAVTVSFTAAGPHLAQAARDWAAPLVDLLRRHGNGDRRLAVDKLHPAMTGALAEAGVTAVDAQGPVELARAVKSPEEIEVIRASIAVAETGLARMRDALRPGITEQQLWSILHATNIALGGEYVETRLLSSGERTNPWFQECSDRVIGDGELVAVDTDINGVLGYYADVSRTFLCGTTAPTAEQRRLYGLAHEELHHNIALLKPGVSFREFGERAWAIPDDLAANRYFVAAHGVGLSGEYPYIAHARDFPQKGYDGIIEDHMVLCVESYVGRPGGPEGVKLEEQVLVTATGPEVLSSFPFEEAMLSP